MKLTITLNNLLLFKRSHEDLLGEGPHFLVRTHTSGGTVKERRGRLATVVLADGFSEPSIKWSGRGDAPEVMEVGNSITIPEKVSQT